MLNRTVIAAILALAIAACAVGPQPIDYGNVACAHCRMTISDPAFASQLVTMKGKVYNFDAIECLATFVQGESVAAEDVHSLWVADYSHPENWVSTDEADFVRSPGIRSPMGMNLTAHRGRMAATTFRNEHSGDLLEWPQVIELVRSGWSAHH